MQQKALPFQYESEGPNAKTSSRAGLFLYLDLMHAMGLRRSVADRVKSKVGDQGWSDDDMVVALLLLNLAGGDCVDDLGRLGDDAGLGEVLMRTSTHGLGRRERRLALRRFRGAARKPVPSASSVLRFLSRFHSPEEEAKRQPEVAFIPAANAPLRGLLSVNADVLAFAQRTNLAKTATLDMDATIAQSWKAQALFC